MTAQRQHYHRLGARSRFGLGIAAISVVSALVLASPAVHGQTTERIVVNRFSGLAIEGFDPIAYFVDGRAVQGLEDFEAWQGGAVWRFHNEGNRASFVAHPEIYGPQFGGYDPIDIARGVTVAGNPRFWIVAGDRLFLFSREESRAAFAANPGRYLHQAELRWPALEQRLAR